MQKSRYDSTFARLIFSQFGEFKTYYFWGIIGLFITHKFQSDLPFLAKELADKINLQDGQLSPVTFFISAIGIIVFRTASRVLFFYPARQLQKNLRNDLLLKIEHSSPIRFRNYNSGQLFQYLTGDIDQIRALIGFVGLQGANFLIAMIILIPKIIQFNSKLVLALLPLLLTFIFFTIIVSKNKIYFKKTQEMQGEVQNLIIETYNGKNTIKNFHAEHSFTSLFSELSLKELYFFYRASLPISISLPLIYLGIGLSLLWGAQIIKAENLGASSLILFSGFIFLFMEPMSYLSWIGVVVSRSSASWKRLVDLHTLLSSQTDSEEALSSFNKNREFLDLYIPFWDQTLNLKFQKNKLNVFVSKTGHGKTELLIKIAEVFKSRNESVSLVSQDPFVYNDTVKSNIFLGHAPTDQEMSLVLRLLKVLGLDYVEPDLTKLLGLEVGEFGKKLSGGQMKRLCLIRSLMSDANVILWDDPFSSVDLILEKEIFHELKAMGILKNKTIIMTSHRLTTVRNSDFYFYLDKDLGIIESAQLDGGIDSSSKLYEYFEKQMV